MGTKQTSLSKKIVFIIAFVLFTLNIALYVTIIGLNKSTLYDMEREKAQLITKTYAPMLAMQIYLDMDDKIVNIAKQMLVNKSVLQVEVFSNKKSLYRSQNSEKIEGIEVVEDIYEPGSNSKIGTIEMTYSVANYEAVLSRNLKIISIFLIAFIFVFIGFSWYIQKQLNPLHTLASILGSYKPDSNVIFPHSEKNDEIGLIARALTKMHERIQLERQKGQQNEQMLIQQSRQAAMGEMIGNIAHQWRQPLNALGLVLQNIHFTYQMDDLTDEFMEQSVEKGKNLTSNMSKTIDDFRDFFKPNKLKENFNVCQTIENTIDLIEASYKNSNIELQVDLDENIELQGYPSEFSQVVLNIISNAKDALIEHRADDRVIKIVSFSKDGQAIITIEDNAGGIPEDIINKIFDPYFSTKEEGKGTGIGLYMSKTIVETNMGGKLSVENADNGAVFTVVFYEALVA